MKILKRILSVVVPLYFSVCMFYCFVAGAPGQKEALNVYILVTAGFSILLPAFVCACIHYIDYLQKRIDFLEQHHDK